MDKVVDGGVRDKRERKSDRKCKEELRKELWKEVKG